MASFALYNFTSFLHRHAVYVDYLYTLVKLVNLLFSVCLATGYIHSGEIKIFNGIFKTIGRYAPVITTPNEP